MLAFIVPALALSASLAAQDGAQEPGLSEAPDEGLATSVSEMNPYRPGDAIFSIQAGANLPLFFQSMSSGKILPTQLFPGGSISLRYMGFVAKGLALGGELGASFNVHLNKTRTLYMVPFTFQLSWIPMRMPFEFPIGVGLGGVLLNLAGSYKFDPILRPEAGIFYRSDPTWSFGLLLSYDWSPQFYTDPTFDMFGNVLTLKLSALYRL
jgi:hypothetical protein